MAFNLIKDWVNKFQPWEQGILVSTLRGCDLEEARGKRVTKMIRFLLVNNFSPKSTYTNDEVLFPGDAATAVNLSKSSHWQEHITGAILIISKNHPANYVRGYWGWVYESIDDQYKK